MEQLRLFDEPQERENMVRSEKELRKWWRERMGEVGITPRWIEPALGSTQGLPDAFMVVGNTVIFTELKFSTDTGPMYGFNVQKEQAREFPKMLRDGFNVMFVVGTHDFVILAFVNSRYINGVIDTQKLENVAWKKVDYSDSGEIILATVGFMWRMFE